MTEPSNDIRVEQGKLSDTASDPSNANLHTDKGMAMLAHSLKKRRFLRPIAAAGKTKDGKPVILAGNATREAAIESGMDDAIFVFTDGTKPIVHVRDDVAPGSDEALLLALEDNRVAQQNLRWNTEQLVRLLQRIPDEVKELFKIEDIIFVGGKEENPDEEPIADDVGFAPHPFTIKLTVHKPELAGQAVALVQSFLASRNYHVELRIKGNL